MIGESYDAIFKHFSQKIAHEVATSKRLRKIGIRKGKTWKLSSTGGFIEVICPNPIGMLKGEGKTRSVFIECKSAGSSLRGSAVGEVRPDLVLIDDLERQKNGTIPGVESPAYRKEISKWFFSAVLPLGEESGKLQIIMLGTMMHNDQLLCNLYNNELEGAMKFFVMKKGYLYTDKNGVLKSLWDAKHTVKDLHERERNYIKIGQEDTFSNEYLSKTHDPKNAAFKPKDYRYFKIENGDIVIYKRGKKSELKEDGYSPKYERRIPIKKCLVFSALDPAISERAKACFSAICTIAIDADRNWYILNIAYGRWQPTELWKQIFIEQAKYKPIVVGVEGVNYQKSIPDSLENMMLIKKKFFNVEAIQNTGEDKVLRIKSRLGWRYESNMIFHDINGSYREELEEELGGISKGGAKGFVDLPDALALQDDLAYGRGEDVRGDLAEERGLMIKKRNESEFSYQKRLYDRDQKAKQRGSVC